MNMPTEDQRKIIRNIIALLHSADELLGDGATELDKFDLLRSALAAHAALSTKKDDMVSDTVATFEDMVDNFPVASWSLWRELEKQLGS